MKMNSFNSVSTSNYNKKYCAMPTVQGYLLFAAFNNHIILHCISHESRWREVFLDPETFLLIPSHVLILTPADASRYWCHLFWSILRDAGIQLLFREIKFISFSFIQQAETKSIVQCRLYYWQIYLLFTAVNIIISSSIVLVKRADGVQPS